MSWIETGSFFYVDSNQRTAGTNESFLYNIQLPSHNRYTHVCVLQANIPLSYYVVQSGSNTFTLQEGVQTATVTVDAGNYNANSFATRVGTLMTNASPNGWTYTVTIPNQFTTVNTGKFTFSVSGNTSQPSIITTTATVYEQLGFNASTTNTFVSNSLTSTNVVVFQPETNLYIHSDICQTGVGNNDILQEIYVSNSIPFGNIQYLAQDVLAYSKPLRFNQSNSFRFSLTNETGTLMNLNGVNMVFTLLIYRKEDVSMAIKNYLRYKLMSEPILPELPTNFATQDSIAPEGQQLPLETAQSINQ